MATTQGSQVARTLDLPDLGATAALAHAIAAAAQAGDVIALWGDLGAGKTTFARAFIAARSGEAQEVPSPTFTLVQVYEQGKVPVWHFDLYRVESPEEVYELGFEEALGTAIALIEWPERLGPLLPAVRLDVRLGFASDPEARRAELVGGGDWAARLEGLDVHAG
jgi:tRNA threonylcarbamoyladenosine biosynthesis protein TsaE